MILFIIIVQNRKKTDTTKHILFRAGQNFLSVWKFKILVKNLNWFLKQNVNLLGKFDKKHMTYESLYAIVFLPIFDVSISGT